MTNMWSFPAYIPGRILGVIKRAVQGRKFRIVEQIIRIISSTFDSYTDRLGSFKNV